MPGTPLIFAVANQKGGVGKTTTAVNLAASLAAAERPTLLVDLDPQANASSGVGVLPGTAERTIYDALIGERTLSEVVLRTPIAMLDVAPSSQDLTAVEYELFEEARGTHLRRVLRSADAAKYDFVIIDSPPSLGVLTLNVLGAADRLIIPLQPEYYALEGITYLMATVDRVKQTLNPALIVEGIVLTMWDGRNRLAHEVAAQVRKHFRVFESIIPRNVRLSEAPSHGLPALLYDVDSKGAQGYLTLAREILEGDAAA
jgi:chromosome partitioning protein